MSAAPKQVVPMAGTLSETWTALGATNECRPPPLSRSRIVLTGDSKVGKTALLLSLPRLLLIDLEGGAHSLPGVRGHYVWCPAYTDREITPHMRAVAKAQGRMMASLETVHRTLLNDAKAGSYSFDLVAYDSGDQLQDLSIKQLSAEKACEDIREYKAGAKGSGGWSLVHQRCMSFLRAVHLAGYGWAITCHTKQQFTADGSVKYRQAIAPGWTSMLKAEAEHLWLITRSKQYNPVTKTSETAVFVESKPGGAYNDLPGGGRVPLPDKMGPLPLTGGMDVILRAYAAGVADLQRQHAAGIQKE